MQAFNLEKNLRVLRDISTMTAMFIAMFFIWKYQNNEIGIHHVMFRLSTVSAVFFLVYLVISFYLKETISKGVVISMDNLPTLYIVSMLTILLTCTISIAGMIYYYRIIP
jgi:hypothetical protein